MSYVCATINAKAMKLYTLSTFECYGYTTANWFFATSREKAEELLKEAMQKVEIAIAKIKRIKKLRERLWEDYKLLEVKYWGDDANLSGFVLKLKYPDKYEKYVKARSVMYSTICKSATWHILYRSSGYWEKFDREELLWGGFEEQKRFIVEIDADKVLPFIQVDGD